MLRYLTLFLFALFPFTILNAADIDKALLIKLYTSKIDAAEGLLDQLSKSEVPKEEIHKVLQKRLDKAKRNLGYQTKRVNSTLKYLQSEKAVDSYLKKVDEWEEKTEETMGFIFDDSKYAVPAKAKTGWISGVDIQPNQAIVEGMVESCVGMYNVHEASLAKLLGVKSRNQRSPGGGRFAKLLEKGKLKEPDERQIDILSYKFTDMAGSLAKASPKWQKAYKTYKSVEDKLKKEIGLAKKGGLEIKDITKPAPLIEAVIALFSEDIDHALKLSASLDTKKSRLFKIVLRRYLLFRSLKPEGDWSKQETEILALNNLYRLSMDLNPVCGNENIQKCAIGHTKYQNKHGMGHYQKEAETKTPMDRAKKAGYTGRGMAENVSQGTGTEVIWRWRSDAGHHRNLIRPNSRAAGISSKGGISTFNVGPSVEKTELDKLYSLTK